MEDLRERMGLMYISDIPRCRNWKRIVETVEKPRSPLIRLI